ncbi:MAG: MBL fold metallo-hydrolase [Clostridia bacterium]|nr:MAG: MBL fold metallo-hydrolase [Clostridia bacterium]
MSRLQFMGAARMVTGSCYILDCGQTRIMVDCGLFQGSKEVKEHNYGNFPFDPTGIDFLLLTHAHIDHCGLIPKLYRHGFRGPILATEPTADLCSVLLPDSANIQEMEVERKNRKNRRAGRPLLQPIYTVEEARQCMKLFRPVTYDQVIELAPGLRARFYDAGHILGSAMLKIWYEEGGRELEVVFSGDIGNAGQPIVKDPAVLPGADFVVMESTYGSRLHQPNRDNLERLRQVIQETKARGGNLLIPAFAVERTQDILLDLNILLQQGEITPGDIYLDSPLAAAATDIFCRYVNYFDPQVQEMAAAGDGECPLMLPGLHLVRTPEESISLNRLRGGAIIIAGSGMCDAGRIKHHLKHNLWRPECTVLLVGFQAQGTLGRRLLEGEKVVRIHGEEVAVRARIEQIEGFSAHADQGGLLAWVKAMRRPPHHIFLIHGEEEAARSLAELISRETGIATSVPAWLDEVELPVAFPAKPAPAEVISLAELEASYRQLQEELERWFKNRVEKGEFATALQVMETLQRELA